MWCLYIIIYIYIIYSRFQSWNLWETLGGSSLGHTPCEDLQRRLRTSMEWWCMYLKRIVFPRWPAFGKSIRNICVLFGSEFRPWLGIVMMLMFCDLCKSPESHRWPKVVCWLLFFSMFLIVFCLWQFIRTFENAARGRSWKIGLEHEFPFGCCCFTDLCENFRAMWVLMALTLNLSHLKSPSENDPRSRFVSYELEYSILISSM